MTLKAGKFGGFKMNKFTKIGLSVIATGGMAATMFLGVLQPEAGPVYAKAQQATLGAGTFEIGKHQDIKPGRYVIRATSGSGNVSNSDASINLILGQTVDNDNGQVDSYTTSLKKGDSIKLEGIESTSFTPAGKRSYKTQLSAGSWVVGKDIKPGHYVIKALQGSGNISTDDVEINEILGTTSDSDNGQVTHITAHLTKGQVLTSDLEQIQLDKK